MKLVDELLCELIADMGIDRDIFYDACEKSNRNPAHHRVVQQILSVEDFVAFKRMMIRKNVQLSEIALKELNRRDDAKIQSVKPKKASPDSPRHDIDPEIKLALEMSKREEEMRAKAA